MKGKEGQESCPGKNKVVGVNTKGIWEAGLCYPSTQPFPSHILLQFAQSNCRILEMKTFSLKKKKKVFFNLHP